MNSYYATQFLTYCKNNDVKNVRRSMPKCREHNTPQVSNLYNSGIMCALEHKSFEVVEFLVIHIANTDSAFLYVSWNDIVKIACVEEYCKIIKLIIDEIHTMYEVDIDWDDYYLDACRKGRPAIVELLLSEDDMDLGIDYNQGLKEACISCEHDVIKVFIDFANDTDWDDIDLGVAFELACYRGDFESVECFESVDGVDLTDGLHEACRGGDEDIVNYIIELAQKQGMELDWDQGLYGGCKEHHYDIVCKMIDMGAKQFERAFVHAVCAVNLDMRIPLLLMKKGLCNMRYIQPRDIASFLNCGIDVLWLEHDGEYQHSKDIFAQLRDAREFQTRTLLDINSKLPMDVVKMIITFVGY
jgi:hypothetical protein